MARYRRVAKRPVVSQPAPSAPKVDLASLRKDDLVNLANELGVETSGTKADLTARIEAES